MTMNEFLLSIKDLVVNYGSIQALKGVNLDVKKGEIITLVGSNGAGKSTLMNAIMGIVPIKSGNIFYHGSDIAKTDTKKIVKEKIVLVPEGRLIFPALNVYDNLMMGGYLNSDKENQEEIERVFDMFPVWLYTFRWRAADARRWSCDDGKAAAAAFGRTILGFGTFDHC